MLTGDQAYILSKEYTDAHGGGSGGTTNYPDLTNKPMINSVTLTGNKTSSDLGLVAAETGKGLSTNDYTDADETKLAGIEAGAQVNVQADWTEADSTSDAYIDHKPTLGTAAAKDSTNAVTDGSVDLVESGAVHSAIAAAISPVQGAVSANTSAISDIKDGTSIDSFGDVETALSGKADVVSSATNGDLAGLDANGNLTDSGIPAANVADHDYVDSGDSAQEALTRASVGWTGKNQAISQDNNSVIGSVQNGKKYIISFDGTATATIKKNSSSGTAVVTDEESPIEITADADYDVYFAASAAVTNIMLRDARIKDSTFEPYHESVDKCKLDIEAQKIAGAVNLFKYTRSTETVNTVVFAVNSDLSVTAVGTNDSDDYIRLDVRTDNYFNGTYKAVGCPYGWGNDPLKAMVVFREDSESGAMLGEERGEGITFTTNNHRINVRILIAPHAVLNGTFKIMITPVLTATYNDYVPYAMTNKELTENKSSKYTLSKWKVSHTIPTPTNSFREIRCWGGSNNANGYIGQITRVSGNPGFYPALPNTITSSFADDVVTITSSETFCLAIGDLYSV